MMPDSSSDLESVTPLTPRQDRLEAALVRALVAGATRSELRDIVREYADLLTLQGESPDRTLASVRTLVRRALPRMHERDASLAGDSGADRQALIERWCLEWLAGPVRADAPPRALSAHHPAE